MTDDEYRIKILSEAKIKYPFFVRDEMSIDEYFDELHYYLVNIRKWLGGRNGYKSLYQQRMEQNNNG